MRRTGILVLLAACGLAACGGSTTTKTVTVTKTVTAPAPAPSTPQATTPPGGEDTTATTTPAPGSADASPLPDDGVVAADGTYKMRTRQSDFDGENITVDDEFPTDSEWIFTTTCQGTACSIAMRRELGSGAFKDVTLQPDPAREGVYTAETSGTTGCANDKRSPTKQRYSVRLMAPENLNGRMTAKRMDVYFVETARGCTLSTSARGVVSWRGNRE